MIDTADIDVSSPRILSHDGNRPRNRLRRDRPTIKIRSQALKDNPALRQHNERHEKSVGELLMEKFFIKDKKSDGEGQQVRLYHQVSLERDEENEAEEREITQKRITRRFTRRRSSAELQLDPEQMQREAAYAQVQAQVLDSLVAEEQAQIENEARRGTLIRKGTVRGQTTVHPYYTNNDDSDTMTREEEEAAALRMRKAMKKTKKKKKQTDKPSPPDKLACVLDNRRSSTSSEMSTDSKIGEEEEAAENGPRPQMYKIEACNSAGDFSTIWVNASENEKHKLDVDQYRESVRVPIPRKFGVGSDDALSKNTDEAETRVVLPVRKPYVKDPSRNSVYLTVKKPVEKLDEKLDGTNAKDNEDRRGLANGFVDTKDKIHTDDSLEKSTSEESPKLNGEVRANSNIKDIASKKIAGKREKKIEPFGKKDVSKSPLDNDDLGKRDIVLSKVKNNVREGGTKDASSPVKDAETAINSIGSDTSAFVSTNAQTKQAGLSKDILATMHVKKNTHIKKDRENDVVALDVTEKCPQIAPITKMPEALAAKDSVTLVIDKHAEKEEEGAVDAPKIPTISREDVTTRRSVVSIDASDTSENSASSVTLTPAGATCLPKPSKINADRNNAVEAPELSLREAAYLADSSPGKSERAEDVEAASLPGKKADKAPNLAKNTASCHDTTRKASGVDAAESTLEGDATRDNATKLGTRKTTLREDANSEVRSNEREVAKITTNVKSTKDIDTAKTSKINAENASELSLEATGLSSVPPKIDKEPIVGETPISVAVAPKETNLPKPFKTEKISTVDVRKDPSRDSGLSSPKSKVPKFSAVEIKSPFKPKTQLPKTVVNETSGKDSNAAKATRSDDGKTAPVVTRKDVSAPRFLKKSVSVDSSKPTNNDNSVKLASGNIPNANIPKVLRQCASVDEKVTDKSMPVKATEVVKSTSKETEKKPVVNASSEKSQEESVVQLSKSASTESIDFWSEIKAPDSPKATISKLQRNDIPREATVISKNEDKTDSTNSKWIPGDPPSGKSSTVTIKELGDDKKNETDVKISVAPSSSAVGSSDVAEEKTPEEKIVPESPKVKAEEAAKTEIERNAQTVQKPLRKKKNLSLAIGTKDPNATVKKVPLKREDSANSVQSDTPKTPDTAIPIAEAPTPVTVPIINIVEAPPVPSGTETQRADEECEDPSTPTNELPDPSLTKISKWSNRDDLTNTDDTETPVASEEASLAASPTVSPQSSKTKRVIKKKKPPSKKAASLQKNEKEMKETGNDLTVGQQKALKPIADKQLLAKPSPKTSPRSSPKNAPSQRPLDLIRMFYTTPSALLTATPRDLSKVRRAKIKRRKHHSRTPSVSSDSTGSTTSTATAESTDGSGSTCTELDDDPEQKRMNSTRSNDSGFDGSPRISSTYFAITYYALGLPLDIFRHFRNALVIDGIIIE